MNLPCADIEQYAELVLSRVRSEAGAVPVLMHSPADPDEKTGADRASTELVALAAASFPEGAACVSLGKERRTTVLAATYALLTRRRLVVRDPAEVAGEIGNHARSLVVGVGRDLGSAEVAHQVMDAASRAQCGLFFAADHAALSRLIARSLDSVPAKHLAANLVWEGSGVTSPIPVDAVLRLADATPEAWRALDAVDLAVVTGHGRDYCAMGGFVCTSELSARKEGRCHGGHACASPEWPRKHASNVDAKLIVFATCHAARLPSILGPFRNICLEALSGSAVAVIAPYRDYLFFPPLGFVAVHLAKLGLSLGRIREALNAFAVDVQRVVPPFLIFGDPELVLATPSEDEALDVRREGDRVFVRMRGARSAVLCGSARAPLGGAGFGHLVSGTGAARAFLLSGGERVGLVAFETDETISLEFTLAPPIDGAYLTAAASLLEASELLLERAPDPELSALLTEHGGSLAAAAWSPVESAKEYRELSAAGEKITRRAIDLGVAAIESVHERLHRRDGSIRGFFAASPGVSITREIDGRDPCARCGSRSMRESHYAIALGRARVWSECYVCGMKADHPLGSSLRSVLRAPESMRPGDRIEVVLSFEGAREAHAAWAAVGFGPQRPEVPGGNGWKAEPRVKHARVGPGGEPLRFTVDIDQSFHPHMRTLRAIAFVDRQLVMAETLVGVQAR